MFRPMTLAMCSGLETIASFNHRPCTAHMELYGRVMFLFLAPYSWVKLHNLARKQPVRMNHTSKSDMAVSRLQINTFFEDLVLLENLLADLQANQRGE